MNLTCRAFGAPTPSIAWSPGQAQSQSDDHGVADNDSYSEQNAHFTVDDDGTLSIQASDNVCAN